MRGHIVELVLGDHVVIVGVPLLEETITLYTLVELLLIEHLVIVGVPIVEVAVIVPKPGIGPSIELLLSYLIVVVSISVSEGT